MTDRVLVHFSLFLLFVLALFLFSTNAHGQIPNDTCENGSVPPTTPSEDFALMDDGAVVRHKTTGVEWQRCSVGQTWNGDTCDDDDGVVRVPWFTALGIAEDAGDDWRLPNVNELRSIVEECQSSAPLINREVFPNTPVTTRSTFWSASPQIGTSTNYGVWYVNFVNASVSPASGSAWHQVRLVRVSQMSGN